MSLLRLIKAKTARRSTSRPTRRWFWPLVVFFGSGLVYLINLPRTTSFEDSAEFVTAAATLGIPHPSGYPLYVLLAYPFSWLPFGTVPWRVALFSALCAALALLLTYDLTMRLLRQLGLKLTGLIRLAVAAVVLAVGFTGLWWSQAIFAKVYALHALLTVLAFWLLLMAVERARCRWVIAAAAVYGLALANHFGLALLQAPFFYYALYRARPEFFRTKNWRLWCAADGLTLLGFGLPHLWLYWRAVHDPPYIMGRIADWQGLVAYVLRQDYADMGLAAWNKFGLFIGLLWQYLAYVGAVLAVLAGIGLWRLAAARRRRKGERVVAVLLSALAGTVLAGPLAMMLRQMDLTGDSLYLARVYGLAAYPFLAVFAAVGLAWLIGRWRLEGRRPAVFLLGLAIVFLPYFGFAYNGRFISAYNDPFPYEHTRALLTSLPPRAVLMLNDSLFVHDTKLFNLAYLQTVEGLRQDVTVVEDSGINTMVTPKVKAADYLAETELNGRRQRMLAAVANDPRFAGRPLYATFPAEAVSDWGSVSNGFAFAVLRPGEARPSFATVDWPAVPEPGEVAFQRALSQHLAHYYYARAAWLLDERGLWEAQNELAEALRWDRWATSPDYLGYKAYRAARLE